MAEKRKMPARGRREPAAKRRVSEATPQPPPSRGKKKDSTPLVPSPTPEQVEEPLPSKVNENKPLPTLPQPQRPGLSAKQYQSIAESAVLLAALQRSHAKWLSGGLFETYWTKPSKRKSLQQREQKNPPKESMTKLGACNIVIEPHNFDVMLHTVRDPQAPRPTQYAATQRPIIQYGPPQNNFHQYQPYPPQNQPRQIPPYNAPNQPPNGGYEQRIPKVTAAPQPPPPPPPPKQEHPQQPPPAKPSPDPVIQMLATRAASNPELKALMRVVASSKATQEQLRTFQSHIDELNAILTRRNEDNEQRQNHNGDRPHSQVREPDRDSPRLAPAFAPGFSGDKYPSPISSPAPSHPGKSSPGPVHMPPTNGSSGSHPSASSPYPSNYPPSGPPVRSRPPPPPHQTSHTYFHNQQQQQLAPPAPPRIDAKAVIFEFTGSGVSNGNRFLFPPYTILDYFPGGTAVIASFLVIRKIDPSMPFSADGVTETPTSQTTTTSKPTKAKGKSKAPGSSNPDPSTPTPATSATTTTTQPSTKLPKQEPQDGTTTPNNTSTPDPSSTKSKPQNPNIKEYYQPVTMRLYASSPRTLEPLARVVKPPDEVRKYMDDVMDRMERADERFLAFRLPREGKAGEDAGGDEVINGGRSEVNGGGGGNGKVEVEEEEELRDRYEMPNSLIPLSVS